LSIPNVVKSEISIFPNPNNGTFQISLPNGNETVFITNSLGQEIYKTKAANILMSIDLNIPNGLYFVNIQTDKEILKQKVLINH
jgi:hypothetical protein